MPKLKAGIILPTPAEDAAITAAAMSDPDAVPLTDAEWTRVQKIHPGISKDAWDEVLVRSGIDPETVTEYNVPNEPEEDEKSG